MGCEGESTIRKQFEATTSLITVRLRVTEAPFIIRADYDSAPTLQEGAWFSSWYRSYEELLRACYEAACCGLFNVNNTLPGGCTQVEITVLRGVQIPEDPHEPFLIAAGLAYLQAIGEHQRAGMIGMKGWEEILKT